MKVNVSDIDAKTTFDKSVFLSGDYLVLPQEHAFSEEDIQLLKKWNIKELSLQENVFLPEISQIKKEDFYETYVKQKKEFEKFKEMFLVPLRQFYEEARARGLGSFDFFSRNIDKILDMLLLDEEVFLFTMLIHLYKTKEQYSFTKASFFTGVLSIIIGQMLRLPRLQLRFLFECSLLADVGLLKIPLRIVSKKKQDMTPQEALLLQSHPLHSYKMVAEQKFSKMHMLTVLLHHEYVDGTGFPKKMRGNQIPIYSKIIGMCQEFVRLTLGRGRFGETPQMEYSDIIGHFKQQIDKQFDKTLCQGLLRLLSEYPVSSLVNLNNGQAAIVLASNPKDLYKPLVKTIFDDKGRLLREGAIFDTAKEKMHITEMVHDKRLLKKAHENL